MAFNDLMSIHLKYYLTDQAITLDPKMTHVHLETGMPKMANNYPYGYRCKVLQYHYGCNLDCEDVERFLCSASEVHRRSLFHLFPR